MSREFTYQVSDKINVTYTYGENFDINTGLEGNLISLGLSLGAVTGEDLRD